MQKRIPYLDFLRCVAILLVIVTHTMSPILPDPFYYQARSWYLCLLQNPINRTGVPLFFMISGYLLLQAPSTINICQFYRRHIPRLLVPLFCWNIIYAVWKNVTPLDLLRKLLSNGVSYHMWFVYTLLGIYLIAPFLKRLVDHCTEQQLSMFLIIILLPTTIIPFCNRILSTKIFLFNPLLEGYIGYFLFGYLLGKCEIKAGWRKIIYIGGLCRLFD